MCIGPLKRLCHWGPIFALLIVKSVSLCVWHCSLMWWPPFNSIGGFLNMSIFTMWNALTLYHFFSAMIIGPGYLPPKWKPEKKEDTKYLQYCLFCEGYKAPRAHHCRKCNKCVKKMDHHCPWINNCCGHDNHTHFVLFLFCAVCGCAQASVVLTSSLYRALHRKWYLYYGTGEEPIVSLGILSFIFCTFALGMALGVVIAVGTLFYYQLKGILKNETAIENWIVAKAKYEDKEEENPFLFPYNLGWKLNFSQVFNWNYQPEGDGIMWPVIDGCDQYSLTVIFEKYHKTGRDIPKIQTNITYKHCYIRGKILGPDSPRFVKEQIKQKEKKRGRAKEYVVIESFSGKWFPISKGFRVCCNIPCSDESRIQLNEGDRVLVTRWKRHWLYGEKLLDELQYSTSAVIRVRGWFPRICAIEVLNTSEHSTGEKKKIV